ncbi:MAG: glycosyltransferase [Candidatus Krumholzibacteriota bacterium]|nr:glycosyltransferase [Candidatus Krumholzibacteriota bacterium]
MTGGDRPIRVAHVIRSLEFGGAEKMALALAAAQRAGGLVEPSIYCMAGGGPLEEEAAARELDWQEIGLGGVRWLTPMIRLRQALAAAGPAIVHTHNFLSHLHAAPAAGMLGIPVVHTKHGRAVSPGRLGATLRRRLYELSARIVAVSGETADELAAQSGIDRGRIAVVYNGIDTAALDPGSDPASAAAAKSAARRELGLPGDAVIVGAVSRLDPVKDHATMLRAFAAAAAGRPGARLCFVGDGPERAAIETLAAGLALGDRLVMPGFSEKVRSWLRAMDLFLQPSIREGLSLTILEAMAAGVPIVATPVGGTPEAIAGGETGTFVPVGDADALAGAIGRFLDDPAPFRLMAAAARERARRLFSLEGMTAAYETMYREILAAGR